MTNNIVCSSCGAAGHIAKDCRSKRPGLGGPPLEGGDITKIDEGKCSTIYPSDSVLFYT